MTSDVRFPSSARKEIASPEQKGKECERKPQGVLHWTEKHRPKNFEEIKGQELALGEIKKFIENFYLGKLTRGLKKSLILHGPPGTGKTTIAHATARETNSEIFELNASDFRNKAKLQEILRPAIEQKSLIKKNKIILVDEADGISGYYDRGGINELLDLIALTTYPVIITANDIWTKKLGSLRKKSQLIQIKEIDYKIIREVLFAILRKENLFMDYDLITKISVNAKGDLRAAINDLQTISKIKDIFVDIDERNKEQSIFDILKMVFKARPTEKTKHVFESVNMPIDEIILWVEENIPVEYQGEELARAYEILSKVDIFKGRIYKQQYWRFLVYENFLLSYGISSAKKGIKTNFTKYKRPSRILKIWLNNQRTAKKKSIAQKYAKYVHVGEKRAMHEFPIIKQIIKSNIEIQKELKLNEEEIQYILGKN